MDLLMDLTDGSWQPYDNPRKICSSSPTTLGLGGLCQNSNLSPRTLESLSSPKTQSEVLEILKQEPGQPPQLEVQPGQESPCSRSWQGTTSHGAADSIAGVWTPYNRPGERVEKLAMGLASFLQLLLAEQKNLKCKGQQ